VNKREREEKLEGLARGIRRCRKCPLHESRTHAVPGEGNPNAEIMMVGEGPGQEEDQKGRPFVGRSGKFLDKIFARLELKRQDFFITSSVKCRPPENRNPHMNELEICKDAWLIKQIEFIKPKCIVLLGKTACRCMLEEKVRLEKVHGFIPKKNSMRIMITYHPSAAMRFPHAGKRFQSDIAKLKKI
jgi:DNA polymerase